MPATRIAPSRFPLRFSEVVNVRGDFGPDKVANPKGIAYHHGHDRILITVTPHQDPYGTRSLILQTVDSEGNRERFAGSYSAFRDVESMLIVVPAAGPPVTNAHFRPGDLYVNRGPLGEISRIDSDGHVVNEVWVDLHSEGLWGGLAFDHTGTFGGRLIAADNAGKVFVVDSGAHVTLLVDLAARLGRAMHLEGLAVAPGAFGPLGGQLIVGVEGASDADPESGKVYAIDRLGAHTLLADIGYCAENITFVPTLGGTFYHTQLSFERARDNKLLAASASQFLARAGRMLVTNEMSGELWEVAWDGSRYTQSLAGRAPGRWTSEGLGVQLTELEHAVFAMRSASLPGWTAWQPVPGSGTTDVALNACVDYAGNLHLFAKGINDRRIYIQSMQAIEEVWTGPTEMLPRGMTTNHSLASALHERSVHVFAVRDDGHIVHKRAFTGDTPTGDSPLLDEPWIEIPGDFVTDAPVSAAVATGRLVLCAKGFKEEQLYINELSVGGREWSGWSPLPGGEGTDASPTPVNFQDELYLLIKEIKSNRVMVQARSADGTIWSQCAELPGGGLTHAAAAGVSAHGQCYVFVQGYDSAPHFNIASNTGTWSGWHSLPTPGTTNVPLAAVAVRGSIFRRVRVFVFAKGVDDRRIYMRRTT